MTKQGEHEDPVTPYERMLERNGLDCSRYGCWKPIAAITLNHWQAEVGVCVEHAKSAQVLRWLET